MEESLRVWGTDDFPSVFKTELETLRSDVLPIAGAVEEGNRIDDSDLGIIVNQVSDDAQYIYAQVGVFFAQIIECVTCGGGNGLRDEAYCELSVAIRKTTGETVFRLL